MVKTSAVVSDATSPMLWSRLAHTVSSDEQLDQTNASKGVSVVFDRLARGPVHLAFRGAQTKTLSVWSTESDSGFISRPNLPADVITLRFIKRGAMSRSSADGSDKIVVFDQVLFTSFEEMRAEVAFPGFSAITAAVSRAALVEAYTAMGSYDRLPSFGADQVLDLRSVQMWALRNSLSVLRDRMSSEISNSDMITPLLEELLIYQIIGAWHPERHPSGVLGGFNANHSVRSAIDYMEANLHRKLQIADIAAASGLNVRTLQNAFKARLGCSPVQFLISRRLDKVHAALRTDTPLTVSQVATAWGFTHMSDFSNRFKERFGQTPAALKVARRRF